MNGKRAASAVLLAVLLGATAASAAVSLAPFSLEVAPGATSVPVQAALAFSTPIFEPDPLPLDVTFPSALLPHAATVPAAVEYTIPLGGTSATAVFRIALGTGAPPGVYSVLVSHDPSLDPDSSNSATLTLRVPAPAAAVSPASVSAAPGVPSAPLSLSVSNLSGVSVTFTPSLPPPLAGRVAISPSPVVVAVPAGATTGTRTFQVTPSASAPIGTFLIRFSDRVFGLSADLRLTIAALPVASVSPPSLRLAQGESSQPLQLRVDNAAGSFSFRPTLPSALQGNTTVVPTPVALNVPAGATSAAASFRLRTTLATPPGVHAVVLADEARGLSATLRLEIAPSRPRVDLEPRRVSLVPGELSDPVSLTVTNVSDARFSFEAEPPAPVAGLLSIRPSRLRIDVPPGGTSGRATFAVRAEPATPPGTYRVPLVDVRSGLTADLVVRVRPPAGRLVVEPDPVTVVAGGRGAVATLRIAETNAGGRTLVFQPQAPPLVAGRLLFDPPSIVLPVPAGATTAATGFEVAAQPGTPAGTYPVRLIESALGFETVFTLEIRPGVRITSVLPSTLTAGALEAPLALVGENFAEGGRLESDSAALRFGPATVLSPVEARATVAVRADATPGPVAIRWVNPDGASATAAVAVVARDSMSGPLVITTAAIVYPAPGTLLGLEERVYPRGLLAVAGTGNVVAVWKLDGIVFERTTASAVGGQPVAIESKVQIPTITLGEHLLELAIESPLITAAPAVPLTIVSERASALRLLAPGSGLVISLAADLAPAFRWSAVPGAEGYAVEIERDGPRPPIRFSAREPFWRPSQQELDRVGPGVHRWRVRPVFPAAVDGQPSDSRRIVVLPDRVDLRILTPVTAGETAWSGGSPGLVYRLDVFRQDSDRPVFSALTPGSSYRLPAARRAGLPPYKVRVTALAPGGREVGRSAIVAVAGTSVTAVPAAAPAVVEIVGLTPPDGDTVSDEHPRIAAEWSSPVSRELVTLVIDDLDVTAFARVEPTRIAYDSLIPLSAGQHDVHLVVGETLRSWSFRVEPGAPPAPEAETPPTEKQPADPWREESVRTERWSDWRMTVEGDVTLLSSDDLIDDEIRARQSLSLQADLQGETAFLRLSGDLSESQVLDGEDRQSIDQRNYLATLGARRSTATAQVTAGFASPGFLADSVLLTAGLARGGAEAKLEGGRARLSLYSTYDESFAGVTSGTYGPEQEIVAAGLELFDDSGRFDIRAVGMDVEEPAGAFGAGGDGTVAGVLVRFAPRPTLEIRLEAAQGEFTPAIGSFETDRRGNAYSLRLDHRTRGLQVAVDLRHTEEEFVNPANRGLTPGGVSDRSGGELSLIRFWGVSSFSVRYRHLEGGTASGLQSGAVTQNGADAAYSTRFGQRVSLAISGRRTETRSDGDPALALPASTQTDWGADLQLSESFGTSTFTQSFGFQKSEDDVDPGRLSEVSNVNLSFSGAPSERLRLFAQAGGTRTEQAPTFGTTDALLASFQPTVSFAAAGLLLQPYLSYNRSENDLSQRTSETELYQLSMTWAPPRLRSRVALQVANGWSRSRLTGEPDRGFDQRTTLSLIVRWNGPASPATGPTRPLAAGVDALQPSPARLRYPSSPSLGWPLGASLHGSY